MSSHCFNSPPCFPSSRCRCGETPTNTYHTLSPTYPPSNYDASFPTRNALAAPSSPQNDHPWTSLSAASTATPSASTRTLPVSIELAREFASGDLQQLCYIPPSRSVSSVHSSAALGGQYGAIAGYGGTYPGLSLARDDSTAWRVGTTYDDNPSPHRSAAIDTRNQHSAPGPSGLTTFGLPPGRSFASSTSPQPRGAPPVPQGAHRTAPPASIRGNPPRSTADESRNQVLRRTGRWLSRHDYLNTGQDPIIGRDCPLDTDALGIKGQTVFTVFFDHTDGKTYTCYVCSHVSYDLDDAIIHQRGAMHYQD